MPVQWFGIGVRRFGVSLTRYIAGNAGVRSYRETDIADGVSARSF